MFVQLLLFKINWKHGPFGKKRQAHSNERAASICLSRQTAAHSQFTTWRNSCIGFCAWHHFHDEFFLNSTLCELVH